MLLCGVAVNKNYLSAVACNSAVKPVARATMSDADISSDGEEFCDSFDVSSFSVRLSEMTFNQFLNIYQIHGSFVSSFFDQFSLVHMRC